MPVTDSEFLLTLIHGATAFGILRTALELGVFEVLDRGDGLELDQLAAELGIERQPARVKGERYTNA